MECVSPVKDCFYTILYIHSKWVIYIWQVAVHVLLR